MTVLVADTVCIVKKQRIGKHDRDDPVSVPFIVFRFLCYESGALGEINNRSGINSIQ